MPISTQTRNAILSQLDAAFNALEAGDMETVNAMIHQSFEFATGGRTYIVSVQGCGDAAYPQLVVRIKRRPL